MLGVGFISRYPLKFFGRLEGRSLEGVRNPSRGSKLLLFQREQGRYSRMEAVRQKERYCRHQGMYDIH